MKKYDVHVILGDKFWSVVIECDGFVMEERCYRFYKNMPDGRLANFENFAYYPIKYTIIEEHNPNRKPLGSAAFR